MPKLTKSESIHIVGTFRQICEERLPCRFGKRFCGNFEEIVEPTTETQLDASSRAADRNDVGPTDVLRLQGRRTFFGGQKSQIHSAVAEHKHFAGNGPAALRRERIVEPHHRQGHRVDDEEHHQPDNQRPDIVYAPDGDSDKGNEHKQPTPREPQQCHTAHVSLRFAPEYR